MTNRRWIYLIIILFALALSDGAWARGGHGRGGHGHGGHGHGGHGHGHFSLGIGIGGYYPGFYGSGFYGSGFYGPGFYGYRSYGYPFYGYPDPFFYRRPFYGYPPMAVPVTPPVYIQREQPRPVQPQANYWHYCQKPEGYYPYVKSCPDGWLQVAPQPPAQ